MADISETKEYQAGIVWADKNLNRLIERFTDEKLLTEGLRTILFNQAARLYPSKPGDMGNDIRQTLWVAGAFRRLAETLPFSMESLAAVFDTSLEIGSILSAEIAKNEALEQLRKRPKEWWNRKHGDAAPNDIVRVLEVAWRRDRTGEERYRTTTKWEVLIDRLGMREIGALEDLLSIKLVKDGQYWYYDVDGANSSFQVMASDTIVNGRIVQGAGEIIG